MEQKLSYESVGKHSFAMKQFEIVVVDVEFSRHDSKVSDLNYQMAWIFVSKIPKAPNLQRGRREGIG